MNLIVVDVETSGLDPKRHGILSIGAKKALTGAELYIECRLRIGAEVQPEALAVNGFSEKNLQDLEKASEAAAIAELIAFAGGPCVLAGMNPGKHDWMFIDEAARLAGLKHPFSHRTIDLHSLAIHYALSIGAEIPERGFHTDAIYTLLGMEPEPKPHNALTGARMEYAAFQRLFRSEVMQ